MDYGRHLYVPFDAFCEKFDDGFSWFGQVCNTRLVVVLYDTHKTRFTLRLLVIIFISYRLFRTTRSLIGVCRSLATEEWAHSGFARRSLGSYVDQHLHSSERILLST